MKNRLVIVLALILAIIISGCGNELKESTSGITHEATEASHKVSIIYNEPNPQIMTVKRTEVEGTKELMYAVFIKGRFRKGDQNASNLEFSVLANGKSVWALRAFNDDNNQDLWQETTVNIGEVK